MTQYIDKDALVAEIKRRKEINKYRDTNDSLFEDEAILSFLNSLEVKEVDLEKEIDEWYNREAPKEFEDVRYYDIEKYAQYFFELGLKAQKGE